MDEYLLRGWGVGADLYVGKPVDLKAIVDIVRGLDEFALLVVRTPLAKLPASSR